MKRFEPEMIRFGRVADAIGVNEHTLRTWLHRHENLDLLTDRPKGLWRAFDERDVWVLALAVEMIKHGAGVKEAVDAARQGMGLHNPKELSEVPRYLYAAYHPDGWIIHDDEHLVRDLSRRPTVLKISFREVMATASNRLRAGA